MWSIYLIAPATCRSASGSNPLVVFVYEIASAMDLSRLQFRVSRWAIPHASSCLIFCMNRPAFWNRPSIYPPLFRLDHRAVLSSLWIKGPFARCKVPPKLSTQIEETRLISDHQLEGGNALLPAVFLVASHLLQMSTSEEHGSNIIGTRLQLSV